MAKSKKAGISAPEVADEYVPSTYINLEAGQTNQIKDLELGSKVRIVITGKVIGLNSRKSKSDAHGSIEVEKPDIKIESDDSSTWKEMSDDD